MGGYSSLPQLRVPEQPDILEQYAKLSQLKNLGTQQQIQQQTIQSNDLDIQQKKKDAEDQQKVTDAYIEANGNLSKAADIAARARVSPATVIKLKQADIEQQKTLLGLDDAKRASLKSQTELVGQHTQAILSLPPEQRPAAVQQSLQDLVQQQAIPPEQAQQLAQSAPLNDPAALEKWLKLHSAMSMGAKEQLDQADKKITADEIHRHNVAEETKQGVPEQELADYLAKNPGKGPSDFASWKAKLTPSAIIMENQLGGGGPNSALDQAAQRYATTGELPPGFTRSPGTLTAIMKRAAELNPGADIAGNKAVYGANKQALGQLQTQFSKVDAFEKTAIANIDRAIQTGKDIPDLGARFANVPVRMINDKMIGTTAMAKFRTDLLTAQSEAAKVLSSATGAGVLTDQARKEVEDVVSGNLPYPAMVSALNELKNDMGNRHNAYQTEIDNLKGQLGGTKQQNTQQPAAGDFFSQFGGKKK